MNIVGDILVFVYCEALALLYLNEETSFKYSLCLQQENSPLSLFSSNVKPAASFGWCSYHQINK